MADTRNGLPVSVLLVDDEEVLRELARAVLERAGLEVLDEAEDGVMALERYRAQHPPDVPLVVLLDNRMPGLSGLEVATEILAAYPTQVIVLFSAHLDDEVVAHAKELGIAACIPKNEVTKLPTILSQLLAVS